MSRGRPQKLKNPIRRNVTASALTFELVSGLGYDFSEVFEIGFKAILRDQLKNRIAGAVGLFKLSRMDLEIASLDEEIKDLTEIRDLLVQTRDQQQTLMTLPTGDREIGVVFSDLVARYLTKDEVKAYYTAYNAKVTRGSPAGPVVKSLLKDLEDRMNGTQGDFIKDLKEEKSGLFRENLIWNTLVEAVKE